MTDLTAINDFDISKQIRDYIKSTPGVTISGVGRDLNICRSGMNSRLSHKYFSNCHELMKLCISTKRDFISPLLEYINKHGVSIRSTLHLQEIEALKKEVEALKETIDIKDLNIKRLLKMD